MITFVFGFGVWRFAACLLLCSGVRLALVLGACGFVWFCCFCCFVLWFIADGFRGWYWLLALSVWLVCWFAGFAWLSGFLYLCGLIVVGLGCGCVCLPFGGVVWCVCAVVPRL